MNEYIITLNTLAGEMLEAIEQGKLTLSDMDLMLLETAKLNISVAVDVSKRIASAV